MRLAADLCAVPKKYRKSSRVVFNSLVTLKSTKKSPSADDLRPILGAWLEDLRENEEISSADECTAGTGDNGNKLAVANDICSCLLCGGLLCEPVTIPCGHTFCYVCLMQDSTLTCTVCKKTHEHLQINALKINVLIATLLGKWWPDDSKALKMRAEGMKLLQGRLPKQAVEVYTKALEIAPYDHVLTSDRSHALLKLGKVTESLLDAERAICLKPYLPNGYFRKGDALLSLGRYEDATVAYLQCFILGPNVFPVKEPLIQALQRLMAQISKPSKTRRYSETSICKKISQKLECASDHSSEDSCSTYNENCYDKPAKKVKRSLLLTNASRRRGRSLTDLSAKHCPKEFERLSTLVERCYKEIERISNMKWASHERVVDSNLVDKSDFECTLCYRLLWEAVTTPCGHVFCRMCLDRCLDYKALCPLCKTSLDEFQATRPRHHTEFLQVIFQRYLPEDYAERKRIYEDEMQELANAGKDSDHEIPIFVCTLSFPTLPCPLHVFEPRYRLMIRQCMESGSRRFGMCTYVEGAENNYADCGTMLEIRDVKYFPDGRSVIDTVGGQRFRVIRKSQRDGYNTAAVEFLQDRRIEDARVPDVINLHDEVLEKVVRWFDRLSPGVKSEILQHFGAMPNAENDYTTMPNGPSWHWWTLAILPLDPRAQLSIMQIDSLDDRLQALNRILQFMGTRPL